MNWGEFKKEIDKKLTEELGADFDKDSIEIDWIDVGYDGVTSVELERRIEKQVSLRVT